MEDCRKALCNDLEIVDLATGSMDQFHPLETIRGLELHTAPKQEQAAQVKQGYRKAVIKKASLVALSKKFHVIVAKRFQDGVWDDVRQMEYCVKFTAPDKDFAFQLACMDAADANHIYLEDEILEGLFGCE